LDGEDDGLKEWKPRWIQFGVTTGRNWITFRPSLLNLVLLAEGHLHRRLFGQMLRRIWALPVPSG
jgi:hypothetical protein